MWSAAELKSYFLIRLKRSSTQTLTHAAGTHDKPPGAAQTQM